MAARNGHASGGDVASDAAAASVIDSPAVGKGRYRLSNGIVLEFRHVSPRAIRQAAQRVPEPEVPVVRVEAKGRDEPNPNDPAYIAAMAKYLEDVALAGQAVAFMLGVRPLEIPPDMHEVDDDAWVDELAAVGIEARREPAPARLYDWLTLYAITSDEDLFACTALATQQVGLTEGEVQSALASFRGRTGRYTDRADRSADEDGQRDPVQEGVS